MSNSTLPKSPTAVASFTSHVESLPTINKYHPAFAGLARGTAVLATDAEVAHYLSAYGTRHLGRVSPVWEMALAQTSITKQQFQICDWGCGALLGTFLLRDKLNERGRLGNYIGTVAFDASNASIQRAKAWWPKFGAECHKPTLLVGKAASTAHVALGRLRQGVPTLHLAANFLDLACLDHANLGATMKRMARPGDVFVAVSPTGRYNMECFRAAAGFSDSLPTPVWSEVPGRNRSTHAFICQL